MAIQQTAATTKLTATTSTSASLPCSLWLRFKCSDWSALTAVDYLAGFGGTSDALAIGIRTSVGRIQFETFIDGTSDTVNYTIVGDGVDDQWYTVIISLKTATTYDGWLDGALVVEDVGRPTGTWNSASGINIFADEAGGSVPTPTVTIGCAMVVDEGVTEAQALAFHAGDWPLTIVSDVSNVLGLWVGGETLGDTALASLYADYSGDNNNLAKAGATEAVFSAHDTALEFPTYFTTTAAQGTWDASGGDWESAAIPANDGLVRCVFSGTAATVGFGDGVASTPQSGTVYTTLTGGPYILRCGKYSHIYCLGTTAGKVNMTGLVAP